MNVELAQSGKEEEDDTLRRRRFGSLALKGLTRARWGPNDGSLMGLYGPALIVELWP